MSLRRRIADSRLLNRLVESAFSGYVRFAHATSRWERTGFDEMDAELSRGAPVIICLWHQRLIMAPYMFDLNLGRLCTLTSAARAGRLAGQVLARFGFATVPMSSHKRHVALSREVLRRMNDGYSIGIAVDGPRGPARVASTVPLVWARSSGRRIFLITWSARHVLRVPSWDRFQMPLPFSRGVLMCQAFDAEVPRKLSDAETEILRLGLQQDLNTLTAACDRAAGRTPDHIEQ